MGHRFENDCNSCIFRHDPYNVESGFVVVRELPTLPEGTLHTGLNGYVTFIPYPTEAEPSPLPPTCPKEEMCRLFIGQLPYYATEQQIDWLCRVFGGGAIHFSERITKRAPRGRGAKMPTGCIHAYCEPHVAAMLMEGMHKRILVDDTGVWYATSAEELRVLTQYTDAMKADKDLRIPSRPYDTIVAQIATSTYVPPPSYSELEYQHSSSATSSVSA